MKNWITQCISVLALILSFPLIIQAQKTDQQITFENISTKIYGDLPFDLSASATSGLPIQFTSSNTSVATITGNKVTIIGAGEIIITATQNGDEFFNPAVSIERALVVLKANQIITFEALSGKTYGDSEFLLSANSTSGLVISYSSSNSDVASVIGSVVFIHGAGECTITAHQAGNNNYAAALPVEQTLIVNKAAQAINFTTLENKTFGDQPFTLHAEATSNLPVSFSSNSTIVSILGNQITILGAGVVEITASQPGNSNYLAAESQVRSLTILRAPQVINFQTIPVKTYGDMPFNLAAVASSGLAVTFASQYDSLLIIQGNIATIKGAGTVKIFVSQLGNENFLPATLEQTLTINKASQTITFESLPPKKFGDSPFLVTTTSTSGLPVSLNSNRKTVARTSGNTVIIIGSGTASIVASQPGNANYLAALSVIQPLVVTTLGNSYPLLGISRTGGNGRGTIFNVNTNGSGFVLQKNFSSNAVNAPQSGFIKASDGRLYGMISAGGSPSNGVVFSINPDGTNYTVLHNFNFTTGQRPSGNVLEASNGLIYGMTYDGGINNTGVLFRIKKDGAGFEKLYEFPNGGANGYHPLGGLIESETGDLYGMTGEGISSGVIFKIKLDGSGYTKLLDLNGTSQGGFPRGDLLLGADQYLYGLTARGGSFNKGVLFKVKTDGSNYSNLVEFDGTSKGSTPGASLIVGSDGKLYGMTQSGGIHDKGTIFSVKTDGTSFSKLFDFDGINTGGWVPGSLIQSSSDGYLYGMTNQGGAFNLGVAFKIKTDGTAFTKLIDFDGSNGASPVFGPLLEVEPGTFYGMTSKGGSSNVGLIFSLTSAGTIMKVKDFPQAEGTPELLSTNDGNRYFGVASSGGINGNGTIFKTLSNGSGYEKVYDLEGDALFVNKLIHTSDNAIWGAGSEGVFTVTNILFRLNPDGTNFQRFEFMESPGLAVNHIIEGPDHFLYGTGSINGLPNGIIFRFKTDGTNFSKLADIPGGSLGSRPTENLVLTEDGLLFGLTHEGGANNWGTVFKFDINTFQYSRIFSLQSVTTGSYPKKITLLNGGSLCIATAVGGANNSGTLFTIDQYGNEYNKILDFNSNTATGPTDIIQTVDGYIIGSTEYGGTSNSGILYEILTDGSNFKKIFEFTGNNGSFPKSLHFRKAEQVITFNTADTKRYADLPFMLVATNSSGLPVTFTSSDESIVSIEGGLVTIHSVGEVTITASASGNINFLPAQPVVRTLNILKADQIITINPVPDILIGSPAFTLSGTSSSGLPVELTSPSENVLVNGNVLTLLGSGTVRINANQVGNSLYNPAPQVTQTFCVNPIKPIITEQSLVLSSSYITGNQWYRNGIKLSDETANVLTVTESGFYTVTVTIGGCISLPSESIEVVITAVEEKQTEFKMYPNPVQSKLILDVSGFSRKKFDIKIMDHMGKQLKQISTSNSIIEISVVDLPPGYYVLQLKNGSRQLVSYFIRN